MLLAQVGVLKCTAVGGSRLCTYEKFTMVVKCLPDTTVKPVNIFYCFPLGSV